MQNPSSQQPRRKRSLIGAVALFLLLGVGVYVAIGFLKNNQESVQPSSATLQDLIMDVSFDERPGEGLDMKIRLAALAESARLNVQLSSIGYIQAVLFEENQMLGVSSEERVVTVPIVFRSLGDRYRQEISAYVKGFENMFQMDEYITVETAVVKDEAAANSARVLGQNTSKLRLLFSCEEETCYVIRK